VFIGCPSLIIQMSEQTGFTVDQLVIYKLGQIETQLQSISNEIKGFAKSQADQDEKIEEVDTRVNNLETNYKIDRARILTLAGVIAFVVTFGKELITKWLGSLSLH
jgi:septal ring factor EnvC (AmiA/AmiB activator)